MSKSCLNFDQALGLVVEACSMIVSKGVEVDLFKSWVAQFLCEAFLLIVEHGASEAQACVAKYVVISFW